MNKMTQVQKQEFLRSRGWQTYYNDNYWVHPKTIVDSKSQDYTGYGFDLDAAYDFEINNREPIGLMVNVIQHRNDI